ncbi:MAG: ATP-binding cassette domain-containing protein [Acidobacteriota bacterium]
MSAPLEVRCALRFEAVGRAAFSLDVDLVFPPGITAVLGPSGSGKTTLLGAIAGRIRPPAGRIALGDRVFFDGVHGRWLAPEKRRVGYVFQDYLLFPHLTAYENALFGARGTDGRRRAASWLERLGIADLGPRHPATLSGGERQRVALARALASRPDALLLDEPVAALDLATRSDLLDAIRAAQAESGIPFVHVCHSPSEAARVGQRAVVLAAGRVVQEGAPLEVLNAPRSLAVARVAGLENVLPARVLAHDPERGLTWIEAGGARLAMGFNDLPEGTGLDVGLRAEDILLARQAVQGTSARNVLAGEVLEIRVEGRRAEVEVGIPAPLRVSVTPATVAEMELAPGTQVHLLIKAWALHRVD